MKFISIKLFKIVLICSKIIVEPWLPAITKTSSLSFSSSSHFVSIFSKSSGFRICHVKICFLLSIFSFGKV